MIIRFGIVGVEDISSVNDWMVSTHGLEDIFSLELEEANRAMKSLLLNKESEAFEKQFTENRYGVRAGVSITGSFGVETQIDNNSSVYFLHPQKMVRRSDVTIDNAVCAIEEDPCGCELPPKGPCCHLRIFNLTLVSVATAKEAMVNVASLSQEKLA